MFYLLLEYFEFIYIWTNVQRLSSLYFYITLYTLFILHYLCFDRCMNLDALIMFILIIIIYIFSKNKDILRLRTL